MIHHTLFKAPDGSVMTSPDGKLITLQELFALAEGGAVSKPIAPTTKNGDGYKLSNADLKQTATTPETTVQNGYKFTNGDAKTTINTIIQKPFLPTKETSGGVKSIAVVPVVKSPQLFATPKKPANVNVVRNSDTQATIQFSISATPQATEYLIYRSEQYDSAETLLTTINVSNAVGGVITHTDIDLTPDLNYTYRVRAVAYEHTTKKEGIASEPFFTTSSLNNLEE